LTNDNRNGIFIDVARLQAIFERGIKMINEYIKEYDIRNVLNYLRRSRQDVQREKLTGEDTLAAQRKLMTKILDSYGIPYVQRMEIGSGDKIATRPVFKEVLEDLRAGKYDAIAVKEISRLGRGSYADMGVIYELLEEKRIFIITPNKIYDPANSSDKRQIRFELFMSREEFETTRERLTGARYNAAFEGKWMGQIPFGYERNRKTLRLEPIEHEANVVKMIFDMYVNGYEGKIVREKAISTIFKRLGIKTAKNLKQWDTTQIKRVLKNDAYIGVSKFRTTKRNSSGKIEARPESEHIIVEDAHEGIVSKELFEAAQAIIKSPTRPRTKFDVQTYELTGLINCKACGKRLVVNRYKRKRLNDSYYDTYLKCNNGCCGVKYETAEEGIIEVLENLKEADEKIIFDMYQESLTKQDEQEREVLKQEMLISFEKNKAELEQRLKFIQEKHFKGIYTDDDYLAFKKEIDEELIEVNKFIDESGLDETAAAKEELDNEEVKNKLIKIIDIYKEDNSASNKNELLRSLFDRIDLEVIEKGSKKQQAKIKLAIALSFNFWESSL
jgi:site-specific DNA recombinase